MRTLAPLGGGFQIRTIGERSLIQSVPTELNDDHMSLLNRIGVRGLGLCLSSPRHCRRQLVCMHVSDFVLARVTPPPDLPGSLLCTLQESGGHTSEADLEARLGWSAERRQAALVSLAVGERQSTTAGEALLFALYTRICHRECFLLVACAMQRMLLQEGLLWVDNQAPGGDTWYWSMCLTDGMDADLRESMAFGEGIPPVHA